MSLPIILEEVLDPNYEPSEEEIIEYAKSLGMIFPEDSDFIYIAKEGLKSPTPKPWILCQSPNQQIYFFNPETNESTWDNPAYFHYKELFLSEKSKKLKIHEPITPTNFDLLSSEQNIENRYKDDIKNIKEKYKNWLLEQTQELQEYKNEEIWKLRLELENESEINATKRQKELIRTKNLNKEIHDKHSENIFRETKEKNKKLIEEEKSQLIIQGQKEMQQFCNEEEAKFSIIIENELEAAEKLKLEKEKILEDQKFVYETNKKILEDLEAECNEEAERTQKILKNLYGEKIAEKLKDFEYQIDCLRNSKEKQNIFMEKLNELREKYATSLEKELKRLRTENNEKIEEINYEFNKNLEIQENSSILETEKLWAIDELSKRYEIELNKNIKLLDDEYEQKLLTEKEKLESEYGLKTKSVLNSYSNKSIFGKILKLESDISELYNKSSLKDSEISYITAEINHYKEELKSKANKNYVNSQISQLKENFKIKLNDIQSFLAESPKKISRLEKDIEDLKIISRSISPISSDIRTNLSKLSTYRDEESIVESQRKINQRCDSWNMPKKTGNMHRRYESSDDVLKSNDSFNSILGKHRSWISDMRENFTSASKK
ncbi:unnamed protein product [Blepharisma stoltei]|uniref:WW domain-containing protein n=1 Tax=Blepharisma stoltei TaxID=1481888 RepID=A0AAU9K4A9_9CILI|nr:unnamed protein product [Blepharisma stoltei]